MKCIKVILFSMIFTSLTTNSPYQDIGLGRLDIKNLEVKSCAYWVTFYVSGQGLLENKPLWYLFEFIGGIDDYNKYILKRQE
jgi:hypothetical protein